MKKINLPAVIILLVAFHFNTFAQFDIGVKANGGASRMNIDNSFNDATTKNYIQPSYQGGFYFNLHLPHKFSLGAELLFTQIKEKEFVEFPALDTSGHATSNKDNFVLASTLYYLGIPVYVGYNFNRLNINLGLQYNYSLASNTVSNEQYYNNGNIITYEHKYNHSNVIAYDFGARAGLTYKLSNKFSIEANYYYGLKNVLNVDKDYRTTWKWQVQQATIGMRYNLCSIEKFPDDNDDVPGKLDIGIKANGGASYINSVSTNPYQQPFNVSHKNHIQLSEQYGLFFNVHLKHKFTFGWELLFSQINGREDGIVEYFKWNAASNTEVENYSTYNVTRHISCIGLPFYFGYNYKRFNFNLGFQAALLFSSWEQNTGQIVVDYIYPTTIKSIGNSTFDFGAKTGLIYKLSDRFSLEANYYYGMMNLIRDKYYSENGKWKVQQMTIGLRCRLGTKAGNKAAPENK